MPECDGAVAGGFPVADAAGEADSRVALSDRRWTWFLHLCGLTDDDLAVLEEAAADGDLTSAAAASFYDHVFACPELRALIDSTATLERHRGKLRGYLESLFSGRFDDARLEQITKIGRVHDLIGLPLTYYLAATLWVDDVIIPALVSRFRDDPPTMSRVLLAYRRLSICDRAIVTQTFLDAREQTTNDLTGRLGLTVASSADSAHALGSSRPRP